ncbi:MAG: hemolysin family protein [Candidatus Marinimicrobia bacterium]|nr:hemolysin family protein [Candidatus Neomarinimicrobiota bacterium]
MIFNTQLLLELFGFLILVLLSGLFSSSETAFLNSQHEELRKLSVAKIKKAEIVLKLLDTPKYLLISILVGNTVVNISISVLSAKIAYDIAINFSIGKVGIVLIQIIVLTFIILIFGEIFPKIIAIRSSIKHSLRMGRFIRIIFLIVFPLTWLFYHITNWIKTIFNLDSETIITTEEDFDSLVEIGENKGTIRKKEKDMIKSLMKFSNTIIREIMIPRPDIQAIDIDKGLTYTLDFVKRQSNSKFPAYRGNLDNVQGFIFTKDALPYIDNENINISLSSIIRPVFYVPESKKVSKMLREFQNKKTKIAIVVDEFGGTSGMITLEDILEEILGEIQDEHDNEIEPIKYFPNGSVLVKASINLEDLDEELSLTFPTDKDYNTLAGFVLDQMNKIPKTLDEFNYENHKFIVKKMSKRRIVDVEITKIVKEKTEKIKT